MGVRGNRGKLGGQVSPRRVADEGNTLKIRPNVLRTCLQHAKSVSGRGNCVGQELPGKRVHVVLVAWEDHGTSRTNEMIDPCSIECRIDSEPAMEENNDR